MEIIDPVEQKITELLQEDYGVAKLAQYFKQEVDAAIADTRTVSTSESREQIVPGGLLFAVLY